MRDCKTTIRFLVHDLDKSQTLSRWVCHRCALSWKTALYSCINHLGNCIECYSIVVSVAVVSLFLDGAGSCSLLDITCVIGIEYDNAICKYDIIICTPKHKGCCIAGLVGDLAFTVSSIIPLWPYIVILVPYQNWIMSYWIIINLYGQHNNDKQWFDSFLYKST